MPSELQIHPAADWLPELPATEFRELRDDIAKRGLREAILVKHGHIIDGRHRYRACRELGIEPTVQEYEGSDTIDEIVSRNLFRRHLTPQQRAELVVKMCGDKLSADAKERQRRGGKNKLPLKSAEPSETAERIAAIAKVGRDVAREALRVHRDDGAARRSRPKPKPAKPKPPVDKTSKEFVVKKFQQFMDRNWSVQKQRVVRPLIRDYLA